MNERLIIRLVENNQRLRLNSLTQDGAMLRNETDATPRGLVFEFDGDTAVTKFRMDRVRTLRVGFVVHLGELIDPGRTDHLALRAKLGKNKTIAPFLFYDVAGN